MTKTSAVDKAKIKDKARDIFTAKNMTRMAVFIAFAYILYLPVFEFSLLPGTPVTFLKIDFSNVFVMMTGFAMGPVAAIIVGVLKEIIHALTFSQTVGVGEIANIVIMLLYVLIPSLIYKKHRNIKTVFITLAIACVAQAIWSIPVNYVLSFPFFYTVAVPGGTWAGGMEFYLTVWYWAVLFNVVKALLVSAAVLLLYKPFQRLFNLIFRKDRKQTVPQLENAVIKSPKAMEKLGRTVAECCKGGEVILLTGELGAGKTVFCKGLAKGLGVTDDVVSPTFTILNEHSGRLKFNHFDAYRLSGADEAEAAGLCDFIGRHDAVCAIEWWQNIDGLFDGCRVINVEIKKRDDNADIREVTVKG